MSGFSASGDFVLGVVLTLVGVLVLGWVHKRFNTVRSFFQPQKTVQQTGKSPFGVFVDLVSSTFLLALAAYVAVQAFRYYLGGQ